MFEHNTFWGNFGSRASAVYGLGTEDAPTTIHANIFAGGTGGPAYRASFSEPTVSCNLFWENEGGDYLGHYIPSPTDLFTDPLFCDPATGDLTSSRLPVSRTLNGCGQIGALGQGCGTVSVDAWSWSRIKASYREGEDR
ncbi:MAG: hypothetical protein R3B81_05075 [bacterium]